MVLWVWMPEGHVLMAAQSTIKFGFLQRSSACKFPSVGIAMMPISEPDDFILVQCSSSGADLSTWNKASALSSAIILGGILDQTA